VIRELSLELQTALRAKGCPVVVLEREATTTATFGRERIVIEHDEGGDTFGPVRGAHVNPKHRFTRKVGGKITIYAQSTRAGALEFEHRRRAEHILDLVLVALDDVAKLRRNAWTPTGGAFIRPADLETSERLGGAVYEMKFTIDRAVYVQTWTGDIQPEATLEEGGIASGTRVSINGSDDYEVVP
jgi:hypothetical protein